MATSSFLVRRLDDLGHTLDQGPYLTDSGLAYSIFIVIYTIILASGLIYLFYHKTRTPVRIRGFWITATAVIVLHIYVAALFIVYPLNNDFKCGTEFWSMSIVFPLGIALFQVSNIRLMSYADSQYGVTHLSAYAERRPRFKWSFTAFDAWFWELDHVRMTYGWIIIGLFLSCLITFVLYFGSRRFSPDIGFFGQNVDPADCRTGFEWIPSILWQFLWSWVIGPWVLFKTRKIHDTHYWALQTRLCVFSGLPGAPLWLLFLYTMKVAAFAKVDAYWPPAMWFAPGLIVMQLSSIIFPILDIRNENNRRARSIVPSSRSTISTIETLMTDSSESSSKGKDLATSYPVFEHHLRHNLLPLLDFSMRRDFTSENLLFLREVRNFKTKWRRIVILAPTVGRRLTHLDEMEMFQDAARIYFELVEPSTARIPINIDSKLFHDLKRLFQHLHYEPPVHLAVEKISVSTTRSMIEKPAPLKKPSKETLRKTVAPWESPILPPVNPPSPVFEALHSRSSGSETGLIEIGLDDASTHRLVEKATKPVVKRTSGVLDISPSTTALPTMLPVPPQPVAPYATISLKLPVAPGTVLNSTTFVPMTFDMHLFDKTEQSVKHDVFLNTWARYIKSMDTESLFSVSISGLEGKFVPRRNGAGGVSRMTDVEMYDLDLELQERLHHGVLDPELGAIPIDKVNSACAACRRLQQRRKKKLDDITGNGSTADCELADMFECTAVGGIDCDGEDKTTEYEQHGITVVKK